MIKILSSQTFLALSLSVVVSHTMAANDFSAVEANTIIKEDVASTQVMSETCPALIGQNAKFDTNVQQLIAASLADYAGQKPTLTQLQSDAEYKNILADIRDSAKSMDKAEQKSACEDVLNYEP